MCQLHLLHSPLPGAQCAVPAEQVHPVCLGHVSCSPPPAPRTTSRPDSHWLQSHTDVPLSLWWLVQLHSVDQLWPRQVGQQARHMAQALQTVRGVSFLSNSNVRRSWPLAGCNPVLYCVLCWWLLLFRLGWWRHCAEYFPTELIKTADLDPDGRYIFVVAPHGAAALQA